MLLRLQASDTLAVEKQARLRAETKEEDERRERISTTAQTTAIQQQHSKEMEAERVARLKVETEAALRTQVGGAIFLWKGTWGGGGVQDFAVKDESKKMVS